MFQYVSTDAVRPHWEELDELSIFVWETRANFRQARNLARDV